MSAHRLLVLKSTHRMYQVENLELKLEITFAVDVQTFLSPVSCRLLLSLLLCFVFLHAVLGCGVRPCAALGADFGFVSFCKLCAAVECVALCALYCVGVSFLLVTSVHCPPGPRSVFGVDGCILATVGVLALGGRLVLSVLGRVSRQRRSGAPIPVAAQATTSSIPNFLTGIITTTNKKPSTHRICLLCRPLFHP